MRRPTFLAAAAAMILLAGGNTVQAQENSTPVRLIVGFAPGGALDAVARALAGQLRIALNQPVLVENKPGAGQRIALGETKRAKPDGLTLILANSTPFTIYPHIYQKLEFDPVRDFTPLGRVATFELGLSAGPATPAGGIKEYLAWAKANPTKATFGSPGAGTPGHLVGEMLNKAAGVSLVHVPYKGGAPAMNDLVGGQISLVVDTILEALEMAKAGKVRILATTGSERTAVTPTCRPCANPGSMSSLMPTSPSMRPRKCRRTRWSASARRSRRPCSRRICASASRSSPTSRPMPRPRPSSSCSRMS
ncbi:tripartite tricarboxylate transporter substrate-binding protein [Achromobacter insuavis]